MQEWKDEKLVKTQMLKDEEEFDEMLEGSTHQVIGKFPKKGIELTVNGLVFAITYSDYATGMFHAKIKRP